MFDDFRNAISDDDNPDDADSKTTVAPFSFPEEEMSSEGSPRRSLKAFSKLKVPREVLGMTPFQNFLIAILLLLMVLICGVFLLLITGRIMVF